MEEQEIQPCPMPCIDTRTKLSSTVVWTFGSLVLTIPFEGLLLSSPSLSGCTPYLTRSQEPSRNIFLIYNIFRANKSSFSSPFGRFNYEKDHSCVPKLLASYPRSIIHPKYTFILSHKCINHPFMNYSS